MTLSRQTVATFALVLTATVGCNEKKKSPAPTSATDAANASATAQTLLTAPLGRGQARASEFVDDAAGFARTRLGFESPRLAYLLLGCCDMGGRLDPTSSSCPGSLVATFDDARAGSDVAFVTIGKAGITGRRTSRTDAITLPPSTCAVDRFIGVAAMSGTRWETEKDVFVGYFPTPSGAAWSVKRGATILFSTSDASCGVKP